MIGRRDEDGYALVAAVASILVFGLVALMAVASARGAISQGQAEVARFRAEAAADAGVAIALRGLLTDDRVFRWSIDGRTRRIGFDNATVAVRVDDERGKVPLASLDEEQARRLFAALGVSGDQLDIVTDSYLDWTDEDDDPRPDGAEAAYYIRAGVHPRNGLPRSLGELAVVRGFDPGLIDRLREVATLNFGAGSFEPGHATPLAIAVMTEEGADSPLAIARARELEGQRTAIELAEEADIVGRPLTIVAEAETADGGKAKRIVLIRITGTEANPYETLASD